MRTFIASGNHLTNEDVKKIAAMRGLNELSLQNNPSITDIKPLARLLYLEKEKTLLPSGAEGEKENLFAAIEVNKLFNKFNISISFSTVLIYNDRLSIPLINASISSMYIFSPIFLL